MDTGQLAGDSDRVALDELLTDDRPTEEIGGSELGVEPADGFCAAFASTRFSWVDDTIVPLQLWIGKWRNVSDVPAGAEADLDSMRAFAQDRLDWNLGRIPREDRPQYGAEMADRAERIADVAVSECDELPPRVALPPGVDAPSTVDDVAAWCDSSLQNLTAGIALYRELRGVDPAHAEQIELASYAEFLRSFDDPANETSPLWFVSERHGISVEAGELRVVALAPCHD